MAVLQAGQVITIILASELSSNWLVSLQWGHLISIGFTFSSVRVESLKEV